MAAKKYVPPRVITESLEVDMNYALGCGSTIHSTSVACIAANAPNEYEDLIEWGLSPDTPIDSMQFNGIVFSSDKSCASSCYHGPYDSFFNS